MIFAARSNGEQERVIKLAVAKLRAARGSAFR
jgi:hypothetical protein